MTRILSLAAAAAIVTAVLSGCGKSQVAGFESPEKAFEALQEAGAAKDLTGLLNCLSPESQDVMARQATVVPLFMVMFDPDKKEEFEELLAKHGIALDAISLDEEFPIDNPADRVAYIADVMKWTEAQSDGKNSGSLFDVAPTIGDIKIDNDSARATLTRKSGETKDIDFVRLDGRWFVHIPVEPAVTSDTGTEETGEEFEARFVGKPDFRGHKPGPPAAFEAITLDQYNSAWQVTLEIENQAAGELLRRLVGELGLEFKSSEDQAAALQKTVSLTMSSGSRLEAIEAICRQIEMTPVYLEKTMKLRLGARNAAQMPESLAELTFKGDSPATLEFIKITGNENFRKIAFRATNHANKEIVALKFETRFLDASGKALERSEFEKHSDRRIPAGEIRNVVVNEFFMPAGTKTVEATVGKIKFSDATEWKKYRTPELVAFAGPFLVEMGDFEPAESMLTLHVFAAGLPKPVNQQLRQLGMRLFTVDKIAVSEGNEHHVGEGQHYLLPTDPSVFYQKIGVGLPLFSRDLPASFPNAINVFEGKIKLAIVTGLTLFSFDELKTGIEKKAGEVTVKLTRVSGGDISVECSGLPIDENFEGERYQLIAFDKNGEWIDDDGGLMSGWGSALSIGKMYRTPPATIEVRVITSSESIEYPFSMK